MYVTSKTLIHISVCCEDWIHGAMQSLKTYNLQITLLKYAWKALVWFFLNHKILVPN